MWIHSGPAGWGGGHEAMTGEGEVGEAGLQKEYVHCPLPRGGSTVERSRVMGQSLQ